VSNFENSLLDHVAIAVSDIEKAVSVYSDMGLSFLPEREEVLSQGVKTAFAKIDSLANLELLSPINGEGPIQKFIDKNGEGIHHLCFRTEDVNKKCGELKSKGYKLIYETPVEGAHGALVNFVHPKSTGGVLIEISQKKENI